MHVVMPTGNRCRPRHLTTILSFRRLHSTLQSSNLITNQSTFSGSLLISYNQLLLTTRDQIFNLITHGHLLYLLRMSCNEYVRETEMKNRIITTTRKRKPCLSYCRQIYVLHFRHVITAFQTETAATDT